MITIKKKENCCGCEACMNICPKGAIALEPDDKGDLYPNVSKKLCVDCHLCEKVCPIISPKVVDNNDKPIAYASWNTDSNERMRSTSGGVFALLAKQILNTEGYVCGVKYEDDFTLNHTIISKASDLPQILKTKYAQSNNNGAYSSIKELLDLNKFVLYCGTPCQVAGLKSFLQKDYDKLLTVELFCHGIINQLIFKKYLKSIEKHFKSKVKSVEFRSKKDGWQKSSTVVQMMNGSEYNKPGTDDEYLMGYLRYNLYIRPSCTKCAFKTFPRHADISIGDLWGIEKIIPEHDNKGASVVLINSEKGQAFFEKITDKLFTKELSLDFVIENNPSLITSYKLGKYSEKFYKNFKKSDFIDLIQKIKYLDNVSSKDNNFLGKIMITKNYLLKK